MGVENQDPLRQQWNLLFVERLSEEFVVALGISVSRGHEIFSPDFSLLLTTLKLGVGVVSAIANILLIFLALKKRENAPEYINTRSIRI